MKAEFLLEIGCEEIPSRFMESALADLKKNAQKALEDARLSYEDAAVFGTPRRLVLFIAGLSEHQGDIIEKKKGPPVSLAFDVEGNPTSAAVGFARNQGVSLSSLLKEEAGGTVYLFSEKKITGAASVEVLAAILPGIIKSISFQKPMFWQNREVRFARPIRWLLALFGNRRVPFEYAGLKSEAKTYGHRFLAPGPFEIKSPAAYFSVLEESFVVLDQKQRRQVILKAIEKEAAASGGKAVMDETLVEEVVYLVEYPTAIKGAFASEYLKLPREVLTTSMQKHQRFFPVAGPDGQLKPCFITIANNTAEFAANIRAGNERVLRARLADAAFFYREDKKTSLEEKAHLLKNIVFQEGLGSLWDKTLRIQAFADSLGKRARLKKEEEKVLLRAASLSKADLVTSMVCEFTELQGIMGKEYALVSDEKKEVARAIYEHYLPRFAGDALPATLPGAILSLVDKLDNITAAFMLGKEPTGSQDPFALRRQALGIVHILSGWEFPLDLKGFLVEVYDRLAQDAKTAVKDRTETAAEVWGFILQRIKYVLLEKGLRYDVIDALLAADCRDVRLIINRVHVLQKITGEKFLQDLMTALTRVANLAAKASEDSRVDLNLLEAEEEKDLYRFFLALVPKEEEKLAEEDFRGFLALGASLMPYVNNFFDNVMVMVEDAKLRHNRLGLLSEIDTFFRREVDLSKIVQL